jgi:hypothetical protein
MMSDDLKLRCENKVLCESVARGASIPCNALIGGLCYFCHLYNTNYAFAGAINGKGQFKTLRLPFRVKTNLPGQYCHERTLQLAQGPFPVYDVNNYVLLEDGCSWIESNVMCYANGLCIKSDRVLPNHAAGDGEQLHPIRPSVISCTTYKIPTIEFTLYNQYGMVGKKLNKRIAQCIFQESLAESRVALLPMFQHKRCVLNDIRQTVREQLQEVDTLLNAKDYMGINNCSKSTWYATVWCRVYISDALGADNPKIKDFRNRHVPLLLYLDTLPSKEDIHVDATHLCSLYKPLGKTQYDEDRNLIERTVSHYPTRKRNCLEILKEAYPKAIWEVPEAIEYLDNSQKTRNEIFTIIAENGSGGGSRRDWETHKYYYACAMIMTQCKVFNDNESISVAVRDALWFYHGCFLDYYYSYGGLADSEINFERVYPHPNRAFTCYDLPNAFHILMNIPNHGEKTEPGFVLGKFIVKTLPFCCAYRTLIHLASSLITSDLSFWKVFSGVFYCLLLDMYPSQETRTYDLPKMMRSIRLCSDRYIMRDAISRSQKFDAETDRGCNIIFTAFRMWILCMADNQRHYKAFAHDLSDDFARKTREMARMISVDDSPDPFATTRERLSGVKSSPLVYRYQKLDLIHTLHEKMSHRLENMKITDEEMLSDYVKTNILNELIYTQEARWLEKHYFSAILCQERYGSIEPKSADRFEQIIGLYAKVAKPAAYVKQLVEIDRRDFQVLAWYVFVVKTLQAFKFEPISLEWYTQLQEISMRGKRLWTPKVYDVFGTICCNKIKSLIGVEEYGTNNVAFDPTTCTYVCAKAPKKIDINNDDNLLSFMKKEKRDKRKAFYTIPCEGNPVIQIHLDGCILFYANSERYMHCPTCGAFHIYKTTNWMSGGGERYLCENCPQLPPRHITCTLCMLPIPEDAAKSMTCTIMAPLEEERLQHVYFCKKHYTHAKTLAFSLQKGDLFKTIIDRTYKRMAK